MVEEILELIGNPMDLTEEDLDIIAAGLRQQYSASDVDAAAARVRPSLRPSDKARAKVLCPVCDCPEVASYDAGQWEFATCAACNTRLRIAVTKAT